jgi:hypothetical protein
MIKNIPHRVSLTTTAAGASRRRVALVAPVYMGRALMLLVTAEKLVFVHLLYLIKDQRSKVVVGAV